MASFPDSSLEASLRASLSSLPPLTYDDFAYLDDDEKLAGGAIPAPPGNRGRGRNALVAVPGDDLGHLLVAMFGKKRKIAVSLTFC